MCVRAGLIPGRRQARPGRKPKLRPGPTFAGGLQIGLKYGPDTARPLNTILIKNNVSVVISAQQNMTQEIIEQICIIDNDKSSELITFNLI